MAEIRAETGQKETFAVPRSAVIVHETQELYLAPEFSLWEDGTMVSKDFTANVFKKKKSSFGSNVFA